MLTRDDREAIEGLFGRLEEAERRANPRDPEAEALIRQKIAAQPAAPYYLAQTVVVQQQALKQAERRIEELESRGREPARRGGPWDSGPVRDDRRDNRASGYGQGGGFLAGAAQTALGVAGGMMLGSLIGSIFSAGAANASEAQADNVNDNTSDAASDTADADTGGFDGGDAGGFDGGGDF